MVKVWIDAWQMQCCGDPFRVGDNVVWDVRSAESLDFPIDGVDLYYDRHPSDEDTVESFSGTVQSIAAFFCHFVPAESASDEDESGSIPFLVPDPARTISRGVEEATGWENEEMDHDFYAYIVEVIPDPDV